MTLSLQGSHTQKVQQAGRSLKNIQTCENERARSLVVLVSFRFDGDGILRYILGGARVDVRVLENTDRHTSYSYSHTQLTVTKL